MFVFTSNIDAEISYAPAIDDIDVANLYIYS